MKSQILTLTITLLLTCLTVYSQVEKNSKDRSRFGIKAGPNYSKLTGETEKFTPEVGFNVGGFVNVLGNKKYVLPVELLYTRMSSKTQYADYDFSMINLNTMLSYFLSKHFFIEGGVMFGVYLSASEKNKANNNIKVNLLEADDAVPLDLSLGLGLGYEFTNRVFLNLRPSYGVLPSMAVDPMFNTTFNIGYTF